MKVGILSDSHGNLENLEKAARCLLEKEEVEILVHLGDDYDDAKVLERYEIRVIKIPGVFSSYYQDPGIPNRLIETFKGKKILISHTETPHKNDLPKDLKPEEVIAKKEVDLAFVGHTHIPKIEDREGVLILNPGHLQKEDKKGYLSSFGLVDFDERIAKIINLEKRVTIIQKSF
ncbi:MAG: metallophosphoesterase family protein [Candidatus Aerophobetes bacterium]|nr:metallophosphoesterase family protein [Candidatus Aerophobetes bacterium]